MPKESADDVNYVVCVLAEKKDLEHWRSPIMECTLESDDDWAFYLESALYCCMALFNPRVPVGVLIGKMELLKNETGTC